MNTEQLKTLDAIIAEMRKAVVPMICGRPKIEAVSIGDVLRWADRIEAAADRERIEREFLHKKVEEALSDEISIRDEKIKQSASGNAAAMREALENARSKFIHIKKCADEGEVSRKKLTILCEFVSQEITDALASPARNCDVSRDTKETIDRCLADLDVESCSASFEAGVCAAIGWMLAAPAKGGAE